MTDNGQRRRDAFRKRMREMLDSPEPATTEAKPAKRANTRRHAAKKSSDSGGKDSSPTLTDERPHAGDNGD